MTSTQKAATLREAIASLLDARDLVEEALGCTDAAWDAKSRILEVIEDLRADVEELDVAA